MTMHQLREAIDHRFSLSELRVLCREIGVDPDAFGNVGNSEFIIELLAYCQRRGKLPDLLAGLTRNRPDFNWKPLFSNLLDNATLAQSEQPGIAKHNLPPRNPHFTGRTDLLAQLASGPNDDGSASVLTQMHTLSGLGGVGKSQIALAYAYAHLTDYELIYWLTADPETALGAELSGLGRALGLPVDQIGDQQQIIQQVKARLAGTSRRWLLIFDNADTIEPRTLRSYLPSSGPGRVIITSRNRNWAGVVGRERVLTVDLFSPEEAVAFVQERLPEEAPNDIKPLAETLGYLPLALEHAVAYCETRGSRLADYGRLFDAKRQALWARAEPPDTYHATITTTWEIGFAHARKTPGAAALLNLCCCLAPDEIPLSLIRQLRQIEELPHEVAQPLVDLLADELALDDAFQALGRYALLTREGETLRLHRLVQQVARDRMGEERLTAWVETALELVCSLLPDWTRLHEWVEGPLMVAHMTTVAEIALRNQIETERVGFICNWIGFYLNFVADYAGAKPYYERALAIRERVLGPDHPDTATSLNNLGLLLRAMGELPAAKPYLERALAIWERVLGPDHPDTATSLNNLGFLLQAIGELPAAKPYYERALAIREQVLGPDHPDLAYPLNNLAWLVHDEGDYQTAHDLMQRALSIFESKLGTDHPNTVTVRDSLAAIAQKLGSS